MERLIWTLAVVATLSACTDRSFTPTVPEALEVGTNYAVFAASSRQIEDNGNYGFKRADSLSLLELTVSIPPGHEPGSLDFGYANPDPHSQFTMAGRKQFASPEAFQARINETMRNFEAGQREVTIFVHGYNATQAETAFRAAQLANDFEIPGAVLVYSWPSKGKPLAYAYDSDSALFARDGLEQLIRSVKSAGAKRVVLVAHSMGSRVAMEALRQIDIKDPGWAARNLGGVILVSPDLDVQVFRTQMNRLAKVPKPFVVFVSEKDKALNVSSRLRGNQESQRLGNISSIELIRDLPIEVVDTTAFAKNAGSTHFIPATSPALLAILKDARALNRTFGPDRSSIELLLTGVDLRNEGATEIVLTQNQDDPR